MKTFIFEGVQEHGVPLNWGKFLVGIPDMEWGRGSLVEAENQYPLLERIGWTPVHILVCDLATGEGAWFRHGGNARADLEKHRIWVCPLFEEFLAWLYKQDLTRLHLLPGIVELPDAQFSINGYRRPGPHDVSFTLRKGDMMMMKWAGDNRMVVCDGFDEHGDAVIRSLTEEEILSLGRHTDVGVEALRELSGDEPGERFSWSEADMERAWTDSVPAEHLYPNGSFSNAETERAAMYRQAASADTQIISADDMPTQVIEDTVPD